MGFGVGSNDGEKTVMMLTPTLSGENRQTLVASMDLLALNPASTHKAEALLFIEFAAEHMESSQQYMLTPSSMTPIRASSYEMYATQLDKDIAELEVQEQAADGTKKAEIADALAIKRTQRGNLEDFGWSVSPESIACYRELAQNLRAPYASLYLSNDDNSGMATLGPIIERYCSRGLNANSANMLIQEMDKVAQMIFSEGF